MEIFAINQIRDDVGLDWVGFSGDLVIRAINICRVPASTRHFLGHGVIAVNGTDKITLFMELRSY